MKKELYKQLKQLREQRKLKQEDVAEYVGVSRQTISQWETGRTYPDIEKIMKLCELYGISVYELMGQQDVKNKKNSNELAEYFPEHEQISGNNKSVFGEDTRCTLELLIISVILILAAQIPFVGVIVPVLVFMKIVENTCDFSHEMNRLLFIC